MRIAALVHFYRPFRNAGSESALHTLLKALQNEGHEVEAFVTDMDEAPFQYEYEGIKVTTGNAYLLRSLIKKFKPDVMVTQHQNSLKARSLAKLYRAKSVFLMHNDFAVNRKILDAHFDLVVFNTHWIAESTPTDSRSVVVHPPVFPEEHVTKPGSKVTLVNLNKHKGGYILYQLAEEMPDVEFMGVVGGHGDQIVREDLPNVEIVEHTHDMKSEVWSRTGIVLMPSWYESYGMVAVEACASGIPVIAHPTPGLKEALGSEGNFVDRDDLEGWKNEIRRLQDPKHWAAASKTALKRSKELDPRPELAEWVRQIERFA